MTDDLISRQAAIEALDGICDRECEYSKKQRAVMCASCHLGSAFDAIDELPSIAPVKHGKWIDHAMDYWCSECGGRIQKEQAKIFSICPYCEAKMDKGEDE